MAARVRPEFNSHEELILYLCKKEVITDPNAIQAMLDVDRGDFSVQNPYQDRPQFIGYGTTISAPHMHAHALQNLASNLKPGMTAMDIGTGSGYLTCAMAKMVGEEGKVIGIDHIEELIDIATVNVSKHHSDFLQSQRIQMVCTDGRKGYSKMAPYDCIHVGAAASESVANVLCEQLKNEGKLIMPVILESGDQMFREYTKNTEGAVQYTDIAAVRFNILTDEHGQRNNGRNQGQPVASKQSVFNNKTADQIELENAKKQIARLQIEKDFIQTKMYMKLMFFMKVGHEAALAEVTRKHKDEMEKFVVLFVANDAKLKGMIEESNRAKNEIIILQTAKATADDTVKDLQTEVTRLEEEIAEYKENEMEILDEDEGLQRVRTLLDEERETFEEKFNEVRIQQIYKESPMELVQTESDINQDIARYEEEVQQIIIAAKAFGKCINDAQSLIERVSRPDVRAYRSWDLDQIMAWITALDNGKFREHLVKLKNGLMKSQILRGELLPELTRSDLSSPPFNIHEFVVKRDLERHFKSLTESMDVAATNEGTDETKGAYIL